MAHPPNTIERASLTPVMSATVTKMLSGTRESADSVARCSLGMIDERSMPDDGIGGGSSGREEVTSTLNRIVHPDTCFEHAERPKPMSRIERCDGGQKRDGRERTYQRGELCVEDDRCVGRPERRWVRDDGGVDEGSKHHGDHEAGEDVAERERARMSGRDLL